MSNKSLLAELATPGIRSVRRNWPPIVALQVAAVALLWSYYGSEGVREFCRQIAQAKSNGGLLASAIVGALGAGLTPEIAKALTGKLRKMDGPWLEKMLFTGFVYAIIAIYVDVFYRLQALMFGQGNDPTTLMLKTAMDMLVFTPFLSIPTACLLFTLYEERYKARGVMTQVRDRYFRRTVVPSLILCWAFWTPVLLCVYAFPLPLQFPMAMLAEAAWSVLFVFMNTSSGTEEAVS